MRIALDQVLKRYGELTVVDRISLEIHAGELFFLLGPSGCGKTTLLRCIAGFVVPDAGRILIGDEDVTWLPPHRRDTGMVFQSYALWPHLTVRENLAFGLEMRAVSTAERTRRVDEALAQVHLADRAEHRPAQLSGGQQQRVALARALVVRPRCLLLDEPLSNLDAKLRLEMRGEIRRICKDAGLTAVYVTHDQKEALSIADRIAVMHQGRIEQCAPPEELYRRPRSRFAAQFLGETNFLDGVFVGADRDGARVRTPLGELQVAAPADAPPASGAAVTVSVRPEALRLGAAPEGAPNRFAGAVEESVYLGDTAQHRVRTGAGDAAVALQVAESPPRARLTPGAPVSLWFDPADGVLLTR
jgi:iron(III) transport system ATP-binding protein